MSETRYLGARQRHAMNGQHAGSLLAEPVRTSRPVGWSLRLGGLVGAVVLLVTAMLAPAGRASAREDLVAGFPSLNLSYTDGDGAGQLSL